MPNTTVSEAVARGDLDELVRLVDGLCAARDWTGLQDLRRLAAAAAESTGRQLWPAAAHAEYRLALEAPGDAAASVLVEGAGQFALGPLPEVAASTHAWSELAPHLEPGPDAVLFAHERVVRGEDLRGIELPGPPVLELPLTLAAWEPEYARAEYRANEASFPAPAPGTGFEPVPVPARPPKVQPADEAAAAVLDTVRTWTSSSRGRGGSVAVDGGVGDALAAIGAEGARAARVTPADAVAHLAWAGASGGAHGRRPGAAAGRFAAWWACGALTGLLDPWPPDPSELGDAIEARHWYVWDAADTPTGWVLRIAVEDPVHGRAWAVTAVDHAEP